MSTNNWKFLAVCEINGIVMLIHAFSFNNLASSKLLKALRMLIHPTHIHIHNHSLFYVMLSRCLIKYHIENGVYLAFN